MDFRSFLESRKRLETPSESLGGADLRLFQVVDLSLDRFEGLDLGTTSRLCTSMVTRAPKVCLFLGSHPRPIPLKCYGIDMGYISCVIDLIGGMYTSYYHIYHNSRYSVYMIL